MGIIIPRPALRKAGVRRIESNLADHADHMARFMANGMTRESASREAFKMVKAGIKPDPQKAKPASLEPVLRVGQAQLMSQPLRNAIGD